MRRWYYVLCIALMLFLGTEAYSQNTFMVMSVKGKVEYKTKKGNWKPVKVGQELDAKDVLKTSFASYVKLMMDSKRLVGIDENTSKKLAEFGGSRSSGKGDAAGAILSYAADQMKQAKKSKGLTEYGAVRGNYEVFNATFPKYAVMTTKPDFRIVDAEEGDNYEIHILNGDFDTIAKTNVSKDAFTYPDSMPEIVPGQEYYWKVTRLTDGATSDIQRFNVLREDSIQMIADEVKMLNEELDAMGADDVMMHLIRGVYYEKKKLFYNAYVEYKETIRLAPEVDEYREMMANMLATLSLYNEQEFLMR